MNKRILLMFILATFLLGGCQIGKDKLPSEMDPKDLPDGRAFEDEFTRSLLQSTEEVLPGYYPFLAKNGRWEMAFPEEGITNDFDYTSEHNFESILFKDSGEKEGISATADVKYYSFYKPGDIETKKKSLRSNIEYPLDFKEISEDDQTYYIALYENELENNDVSGLAGYIQKENGEGGIYVIYTIYCKSDCENRIESELQKAQDWLMTIQFTVEVQ